MEIKCLECESLFTPKRSDAKFCSPSCRKKHFLKKGTVKVKKDKRTDNMFTPNWKRLGLKNKEEGLAYVLDHLRKNSDKITSKSIDNEAVFILGDTLITIKGKKRKK